MAETAATVFLERVARYGDRPALRTLAAGGAARDETLSWRAWGDAARRVGAALVEGGHRPGDAVAILAGNRVCWPVADLGVLLAAGVSVGVYPTSAAGQVQRVLADCGASTVIVDTPAQLEKVRAVRDLLPALRTVVAVEPYGRDATGWDHWLAAGAEALARGAGAELARRLEAAQPDDAALLIYTSGSTGEPRGAEIPHRYLLDSALSIRETLGLREDDTALSFLPYCHAAERVFGLYTRIVCGMEAALVEDHARVWDAARAYRPTTFGGLPRFYEKAAEALRAEHAAATGELRARWDRTLALGEERSRLRRDGRPVPDALEAEWTQLGAPVLARARAAFGGRVRLATSGGAALPVHVSEFLDAVGVTVLGAYGLTEHLCVAFHRPERYGFDSAGPPMPGTEVRTAADGEILVRRGPLTFAGYHGRLDETRAAFTADGAWLLTGDLGVVDAGGCLRVTGRKKELIALSTGKKVAPLPIEALLAGEPWIAQAVVCGEGERFVSALLVLRRGALEAWARSAGADPDDPALLEDPALLAAVREDVERVNARLSRPEQVRRFALLARELSQEADELTPTLKLRRAAIAERYRGHLDALYRTA